MTSGQIAASEGRLEDALREYVWFHEHALEHDSAYYGVRLSFALAYWVDLANSYPEARRKLEDIRERKTALLASGGGDRALFHDVKAINQNLGEETRTYDLFRRMLKTSPALAAACGDIAIEAIIKSGNFALAKRLSPGPEEALLRFSDSLNENAANRHDDAEYRARRLDAYINIYCNRVGMTISILEGLGKRDEARCARDWAVALVESRPIQARVRKILGERYDG